MKNLSPVFIILLWIIAISVFGQIGVGTNAPDSTAILELQSTQRGFLPPNV